jgi:glycosyltransferase involved in cell wall biosynthesis
VILVFEPTWTGTMHAPGNSATIQTISRAFPEQRIRVFADASHLVELRKDSALTERPGITFHSITLDQQFLHRPHIVLMRRFWRELAVMRTALGDVPRGEPCLLILISATSTAIFAASLLLRTSRRRLAVQVGLHGNLNDLNGWRPRNPLLRMMDTRAVLTARHPPALRFLVLEQAIRDELERLEKGAAARTDVLDLPVNVAEIPNVPDTNLSAPVRVGFVGLATEAKGISVFLEAARVLKSRYGSAVEFHLVGRATGSVDPDLFRVLDSPVSAEHLPRAVFQQRLGALHFVFLPYQPGYYNLSASGALLDAITWLKPIIATRTPIVSGMFERHGDIGYLCAGLDEMIAVLDQVVLSKDAERYGQQRQNLLQARLARMPSGLAHAYRTIIAGGFPDCLEVNAGHVASQLLAPIPSP